MHQRLSALTVWSTSRAPSWMTATSWTSRPGPGGELSRWGELRNCSLGPALAQVAFSTAMEGAGETLKLKAPPSQSLRHNGPRISHASALGTPGDLRILGQCPGARIQGPVGTLTWRRVFVMQSQSSAILQYYIYIP